MFFLSNRTSDRLGVALCGKLQRAQGESVDGVHVAPEILVDRFLCVLVEGLIGGPTDGAAVLEIEQHR